MKFTTWKIIIWKWNELFCQVVVVAIIQIFFCKEPNMSEMRLFGRSCACLHHFTDNQSFRFDQFFYCCIHLWCICLCVNEIFTSSFSSSTLHTVGCVCGLFLSRSLVLVVKFVFCWWRYWMRARMCVWVWVVSGISFYLFDIASYELKTVYDSDKRWNSKWKEKCELKRVNQRK